MARVVNPGAETGTDVRRSGRSVARVLIRVGYQHALIRGRKDSLKTCPNLLTIWILRSSSATQHFGFSVKTLLALRALAIGWIQPRMHSLHGITFNWSLRLQAAIHARAISRRAGGTDSIGPPYNGLLCDHKDGCFNLNGKLQTLLTQSAFLTLLCDAATVSPTPIVCTRLAF